MEAVWVITSYLQLTLVISSLSGVGYFASIRRLLEIYEDARTWIVSHVCMRQDMGLSFNE